MPSLEAEIRDSLERLTGPSDGASVTLADLVARRRRRKIRRAVVVAVPALLAAGLISLGLLIAAGDSVPDVSAGAGQSGSSGGNAVAVAGIEVVAEDGATTRVVMEFDQQLPGDRVTYVDDLSVVNRPTRALYTTQHPDQAHVCDATHDFGEIAVGTVDLILPESWFQEDSDPHTTPIDRTGEPPKFVVCGPHRGFYQYSIWGPASANALDVAVRIDRDRRRLTIEIKPTSRRPGDPGPSANDDRERMEACAGLIRAAANSRVELDRLTAAVATATREAVESGGSQEAQARLEQAQAERDGAAAFAADAQAQANALGC